MSAPPLYMTHSYASRGPYQKYKSSHILA